MSSRLPAPVSSEMGNCAHRPRDLAQLIGVPDIETEDFTLSGRLSIIAKLQAARRTEIERGKGGSWLYDINRHLSICAALRAEYEALSAFLAPATACSADIVNLAIKPPAAAAAIAHDLRS